jgi:preprotein translocase subunit SecF
VVDLFRERKWDLVGRRGLWFTIMAISILACIGAMILRWQKDGAPLNYGVDFTGGLIVTAKIDPPVAASQETAKTNQIQQALMKAGMTHVQVQLASATIGAPRDEVIVRTQVPKGETSAEASNQQIAAIKTTLADAGLKVVGDVNKDEVQAVVSSELKTKAAQALILGCLAIIVWIFIRYDFGTSLIPKYGLCAIFALFHDLIILVGAFSIIWWVVDSPFVAAFLTILGYSVHDTIIIFDRIRENVKLRKRPTFAEIVNLSLLETLARSVNTVLTVEFVLICLFIFGGTSLRGFAGALIIGITSGAWSSIFIASQLLVSWKKREEKARLAAAPVKGVKAPASAPTRKASAAAKPTEKRASVPAPAVSAKANADEADVTGEPDAGTGTAASTKKLRGKKRHRRF